jgi:DNA-binding transcriptional regulator LsrR (DeoR family)
LLPAPAAVGSAAARRVMLTDRYVQQATSLFKSVSLGLVGIGAVEPSKLLASSGNVFSPRELKTLSARGAVGDICLRFFDAAGRPVPTTLNDRVISIDFEQLRKIPRVVGIAGGRRKTAAIRGALEGRLVNVLITDRHTAERLLQHNRRSPRHTTAPARRAARRSSGARA